MRGLKGKEQVILLAINDSYTSISQNIANGDVVLVEEIEQLKGMRAILEANKKTLNPYFRELISSMTDYIATYYLNCEQKETD